MKTTYNALALFSGGLDSILAAKLVMEQGLSVKCIHFVTPFFGTFEETLHWQDIYNLDIEVMDLGDEFINMLKAYPTYGFGKALNPCIDCKILMMQKIKLLMEHYGASFILSGEVMGQRPMSQRSDTLRLIQKKAQVKDILLRPLSAKLLDPIDAEKSGLINRELLGSIWGRGRKPQISMAARFNLTEFPTPAGGCRLADKEYTKRYWPVLNNLANPVAQDLYLANWGRQFWAKGHWLIIGRDIKDNENLEKYAFAEDICIRVADFPGPVAIARQLDIWDSAVLEDAACFMASFSPKAMLEQQKIKVLFYKKIDNEEVNIRIIELIPAKNSKLCWEEYDSDDIRKKIKVQAREHALPKNKYDVDKVLQ